MPDVPLSAAEELAGRKPLAYAAFKAAYRTWLVQHGIPHSRPATLIFCDFFQFSGAVAALPSDMGALVLELPEHTARLFGPAAGSC
jgi:hypothetical protein